MRDDLYWNYCELTVDAAQSNYMTEKSFRTIVFNVARIINNWYTVSTSRLYTSPSTKTQTLWILPTQSTKKKEKIPTY